MFGAQQSGNFPGAAVPGASGGQPMRSSVFGGSLPVKGAAVGGNSAASSVFGGLAVGFGSSSTFGGSHSSEPRSMFGGSSDARAGQTFPVGGSGALTPAAVFGDRSQRAPSVFGASPVSSPALAAVAQQPVNPAGFFDRTQQPPQRAAMALQGMQSGMAAASGGLSGNQAAAAAVGAQQAVSPASVFGARSASTAAGVVFGAKSSGQVPAVFGAHAAGSSRPPAAGSLSGPGMPGHVASGSSSPFVGSSSSAEPAHASHAAADGGDRTMTSSGSSMALLPPQPLAAGALFGKAAPADVVAPPAPGTRDSASSATRPQQPLGSGLFGKAAASPSEAASGAGASASAAWQLSGLLRPLYSELADLTDEELGQFKASSFTLNKVPLKPPPRQLVQ